MPEQTPETGLTLGKAKQFLEDNFSAYTMKKSSAIILGEYEWDVKCKEEIDDNRSQKRNFRLYTKGLEDGSKARWEFNQGPILDSSLPPELTFISRLETYIKTKIDDNTIKFGFVAQSSELTKRALCNAIMPDKTDKVLLVSENAEGVFSFEVLQ